MMIKTAYENYVLPKMLDCCCSTKPISYQRKKIVTEASGTVLEIGIGSGLNFDFYEGLNIKLINYVNNENRLSSISSKISIHDKFYFITKKS